MTTFKKFFSEYDFIKKELQQTTKKLTEEEIFEDVVGESVPSVNSFIAWLVLNEHISAHIKLRNSKKPFPIFKLPSDKKVLHVVKNLPNVRILAKEFVEKWKS
jgi:hypothetical protein